MPVGGFVLVAGIAFIGIPLADGVEVDAVAGRPHPAVGAGASLADDHDVASHAEPNRGIQWRQFIAALNPSAHLNFLAG